MQNDRKLYSATISRNVCFKKLIELAKYAVIVFFIFIQSSSLAIAEQSEQWLDHKRLLSYEIAGISLNTPVENIPSILESHGYTQTGNTTYTKQIQVPGQRKSIYRIEINDTADQRQISYFRGKSGGRVKSSVKKDIPIPPDEAEMANTLYQFVCNGIKQELQERRSCEPATDALLVFGKGEFLNIENNISAQLSASADSTTIGIKYNKK
ncbi:MAG: hypothetical protein H0V39_02360 [Nitrosomonas sp.]|nr:hypothetical protein [Nitrosomonas sp.]